MPLRSAPAVVGVNTRLRPLSAFRSSSVLPRARGQSAGRAVGSGSGGGGAPPPPPPPAAGNGAAVRAAAGGGERSDQQRDEARRKRTSHAASAGRGDWIPRRYEGSSNGGDRGRGGRRSG